MGLKIGIDIDDVLAESLPLFIQAFNRRFRQAVPLEEAAWEIFERFPGIGEDAKREFFQDLNRANFLGRLQIYPEAREAVERLRSLGHCLFIVTGRWELHREVTSQWLREAGIFHCFEQIIHKNQEPVAEFKRQMAGEMTLDTFIEDELHIASSIANLAIPVFLFDRPWNRGDHPQNVVRVHSWPQAVDCLAHLDQRPDPYQRIKGSPPRFAKGQG